MGETLSIIVTKKDVHPVARKELYQLRTREHKRSINQGMSARLRVSFERENIVSLDNSFINVTYSFVFQVRGQNDRNLWS